MSWYALHTSRVMDPIFCCRVKQRTLVRYKRALLPFTTWALQKGLQPVIPEDWDEALLEYRAVHPEVRKNQFVLLLASVEFFLPPVKRQLQWSHLTHSP